LIAAGELFIGGESDQKLAQTVTVGQDGRLVGLFLPIGCASGRLVIELRNVVGGQPGEEVFARRRFRAENVPSVGPVFHLFELHGALLFAEGDRFAIVLDNPKGFCSVHRGPVGDSYAGGEGFFDARPNPSGWVPFSEFQAAREDLPFMTEMKLRDDD
jgi:hypothetical protein